MQSYSGPCEWCCNRLYALSHIVDNRLHMSDSVETKLFWRAMIEHYWRPPCSMEIPWNISHAISWSIKLDLFWRFAQKVEKNWAYLWVLSTKRSLLKAKRYAVQVTADRGSRSSSRLQYGRFTRIRTAIRVPVYTIKNNFKILKLRQKCQSFLSTQTFRTNVPPVMLRQVSVHYVQFTGRVSGPSTRHFDTGVTLHTRVTGRMFTARIHIMWMVCP